MLSWQDIRRVLRPESTGRRSVHLIVRMKTLGVAAQIYARLGIGFMKQGTAMNVEGDIDDAARKAGDESIDVHASRRRFMRAGLSSSIVLGSLHSKPVLGAAPYHCTPSGQLSGNLSRTGAASECAKGDSISTWLVLPDWTAGGMKKGSLPDDQCNFTARTRGTPFNGFTTSGVALKPAFFNEQFNDRRTPPTKRCDLVMASTLSTVDNASMLQVLSSTGDRLYSELGRIVVVSLLNAYKFRPNYPVTPEIVIQMFNDTYDGGLYEVNSTARWNQSDVKWYLKTLYRQETAIF